MSVAGGDETIVKQVTGMQYIVKKTPCSLRTFAITPSFNYFRRKISSYPAPPSPTLVSFLLYIFIRESMHLWYIICQSHILDIL